MKFQRNSSTQGIKIYEVGGAIRDGLLGVQSKDRDFVCIGKSFEQMKEFVTLNGGEIFLETPHYFTIRAKMPELGAADFVLGRLDGAYRDGRRPEEVFLCESIEQELSRRDFTVNAMARDCESGELHDPFNGASDLQSRLLRCVGDTEKRMTEDALRIMRAIRFSIVKGFLCSEELADFISQPSSAALLRNVSVERIREELLKCFDCDTLKTLEVLDSLPFIKKEVFSRNLKLTPTIFQVK